mmetsp:Transcript_5994/g.23720  ORF Transcript_5994/g.23720 Transcript_5994/m.23720 type:complete len:226 (+) Transcript_5994:179-856(+)
MQSDEVVWQIINHAHCSYKSTSEKDNFCRNEYNVTGLCNRSSCPLANSQYATVLEEDGKLYLAMKTAERAHKPASLWERVLLSVDYADALEQITCMLKHWPKFLVHKNKQRLTKLVQYLIRCRRLNKTIRPDIVTMPRRETKREVRKEAKAEKAAKIQTSIEKELLERLSNGTYNSAYKFSSAKYIQELSDHHMVTRTNEVKKKRKVPTRMHRELEFEIEETNTK